MESLGLYIHVPFCQHKCGYCDFNSWAETRLEPQKLWLEAIVHQSNFWSRSMRRPKVDTIFLGGGTPSLLDDSILAKLVETLSHDFQWSRFLEFNLEANPETLNRSKLALYSELGINRLSIGIQSFQDEYLDRLERQARRKDNLRTLELVAEHWSHRWSLDLMFGLPEQSLENWLTEMDEGLSFSPSHVSAYQLTLSTTRSKNWKQAGADELFDFYKLTRERMKESGLDRYETSNYCQPGFECQHNLKYWEIKPFLGMGPGASGLLSPRFIPAEIRAEFPYGCHQKSPPRMDRWLEEAGIHELKGLKSRSGREHVEEILMMGLRLEKGVDEARFKGAENWVIPALNSMQVAGFIEKEKNFWKCTERGAYLLDFMLEKLFALLQNYQSQSVDSAQIDPTFT